MKKIYSVIFVLIAFILTMGCFTGFYNTFADTSEFHAKSKSAYLIDYKTNTVIYSKNELEHLPIASMCKVMTLLICFDALQNKQISLDETVIISENASGMGGSQVFLETNGEYKIGDLIKSITVASANDACVAMAEKLYGSENNFVQVMNDKARELEMNNTIFTNCTGLPQAGQYSCAKDVAVMFSKLLEHEEYYKFSRIWTDVVLHPNERRTEISNTNKLIRFYKGCDSGKTGYTSEAGHCLVASAIRNNMRLISVVICSKNSKERFNDVSCMFNFGFDNYVNKLIIDNEKPLDIKVEIKGGKKDSLQVFAEKPLYIFSRRDTKRAIEINFEPINKICAPISKGEIVGKLIIYENGIEINSVNVLSGENIYKKTYFDIIQDIGKNWALI